MAMKTDKKNSSPGNPRIRPGGGALKRKPKKTKK